MMPGFEVGPLEPADWDAVRAIYLEGISTGGILVLGREVGKRGALWARLPHTLNPVDARRPRVEKACPLHPDDQLPKPVPREKELHRFEAAEQSLQASIVE